MESFKRIEIIVGIFVFVGIASMGYMALKLGEVGGLGASGYRLSATFTDVGGLRTGGDVMIAGVAVGSVQDVRLKGEDRAELILRIDEGVRVTEDAIASIRTKGIIGDRYVRISQGASTDYLADGDYIEETEKAINIEDLIAKYIFSAEEQ